MKQPLNSLTVSRSKSNLTRVHINDNKLLTTRYLVIACNDHQNNAFITISAMMGHLGRQISELHIRIGLPRIELNLKFEKINASIRPPFTSLIP